MKRIFVLSFAVLVGCIPQPKTALGLPLGAAPPTPEQISSCQNLRSWQNVWTVLGAALGAGTGAAGTTEALTTDKTVQIAIGVTGACSGVIAAIATTAAGLDASQYTTDNCQTILSEAMAAVH